MKIALLITGLLVCRLITAQTVYDKGMEKAFAFWENNQMDEAENLFERIAIAETNQWLPHYYIAQINSLKSWNETDKNRITAQLDKAQKHISAALAIAKDEPEIIVMQAQILTNWVVFDGMTYGMKYAGKITALYTKAYALAPKNPRVVFSKADWAMGSARYFGQDTAPFCSEIERSVALFTTFKPESKWHPNWGKSRCEEVLKTCKNK